MPARSPATRSGSELSRLRCATLALVLLLATGGCSRTFYNFGTVEEDTLYRSAQPSPLFLERLLKRYEIRSLINLRGRTPGYESAFAAKHGLRLFTFDMSASRPPSEADVQRFLELIRDPENLPAVVHCRNGVDRTGYMVGLFRMAEHDWSAARARREMNRFWQFKTLNEVPHRVVGEGLRADP